MTGSDEGIKLVLFDGKVIGAILRNVDEIALGIDVVTDLGSVDVSFDGYNDGKLDRLLLLESLGYTDGKVLGSDEDIKLETTDAKLLETILGNVNGITLGIDVGAELDFLDGSLDGSNDGKLEELFLVYSLGYNDGRHQTGII